MEDIYTEEVKVSFDKSVMGSFGDFETDSSHELNYIMATIDISKIDDLKTASSVLNFKETKFEELVQRDIDYERVEDELIEKYLEKGQDKFIFFPPLLVSPMITDVNGKIIDTFDVVQPVTTDKELTITYDNNIRMRFPRYKTPPPGYPYSITNENRLVAIKSLAERNPDILKNIKIPICLFFAPKAFSDSGVSLTKSMRQLFVVINSTAKQVSGHFITLLNDDSLSSFVIREFADSLKSEDKLHLFEWNERKEKRASQLNRPYSISTIKILDDAINEYVLKTSLTDRVLNLREIEEDIYTKHQCTLDYVDFDNESFIITRKVKEQINKYLVVNLKLLFLNPRPYAYKKEQLSSAFSDLERKISLKKNGAKSFRDNVLYEYREYQERFDASAVKDMQDEFLDFFKEEPKYNFYYKNIFQQGYIKAWIDIFDLLSKNRKIKVDIGEFTKAFISVIESTCFNKDLEMFSSSKEYTRNVLYKDSTVKVTKSSRIQIANLIKSIFINERVINQFVEQIDCDKDMLFDYAKKSGNLYFKEYRKNNIAEITKNWKTMLDSEDKLYLKLDDLTKNIELDNNQELFEKEVSIYTVNNTKKAKIIFSNVLDINHENITL